MMSIEYDDYEKFIAYLVDNVKKHGSDITDIGFGRSNRIRGGSGQRHQVDVSFIDKSSFSKPDLVLIECKRNAHDNHVSPSVPKILKYNADDIKKNPKYHAYDAKMIITTTSAFSSGAKRIADFEKIKIWTVNHGPPYGFSYGSLIQLFMKDDVKVNDWAGVEIIDHKKKE
jgi:hypothetical protein